ncbi:MAG: TetR/AcrR family transcriptional repressor of nem operon [Pseudoalteromonas rhizosphaerae]|jgi:TetR/AcrR family transcriptional repressor of nem operon|uniref:TetR family transcriptional regulator n=2 Tax=Pseudoalteromonas TaxID=53246 RepID=A0ABY3FJA2_9GAMM|nr:MULTISPECIES: TetR/AcrR family transcriptional regulator [Pseudoalteromonas]MBB1294859.1 TetR/AcrR family transcriptional regulator [Pseudoalteromonas sp. SR41-4]MBB1302655.1 TetR/AcrR family transcriptional regulator [Pseudoalteromonas sp. SR44-8]MBB1311306.1 TetR/AcrR family transcriptional regulator [Pseudoalteromonas sp. SR41-8]MBB1407539.1 TetR/AcrR family transcriptional regulator [Pseudoalteromonas sp. SG44-17]MBB1503873.1 TetR/AcrR family transcriptional regulator [Pseudoalteromonas
MLKNSQNPPRRGRPPKVARSNADTKALLIATGVETLTEFGFSATGLDTILKKVGVPKGSFYHYFNNKDAYGLAVIDAYNDYFVAKLIRYLGASDIPPLERLINFTQSAARGMQKYDFSRGCLVGNLNQELNHLSADFKNKLLTSYEIWQQHVQVCLAQAQQERVIAANVNTTQMSEFFWIGWEGAVMRAKLTKNTQPLILYTEMFLRALLR